VPKPGGKKTRASDEEAAWGDLPDDEVKKQPTKKKTSPKDKEPAAKKSSSAQGSTLAKGSRAGSAAESYSDVDMSASEIERRNRELEEDESEGL